MNQIKILFVEALHYLHKAWDSVQPVWAIIASISMWILFPEKGLITVATVLMLLIVIDFLTKFYAISKNNGGYFSAVRHKKLTSNEFWEGTKPKLVAFGTILVLCGLSIRLDAYISPVGKWFAMIAYSIMFIREIKSINENMIDAGHQEFVWIAEFFKKKVKDIFGFDIKWKNDSKKQKNKK